MTVIFLNGTILRLIETTFKYFGHRHLAPNTLERRLLVLGRSIVLILLLKLWGKDEFQMSILDTRESSTRIVERITVYEWVKLL